MSLEQTGALVRAHDSSQSIRPGTQAEALARAVAESMPGGVLVVDAAGVIALANRQIESQFGYGCAELVGQSIDILLPESSRAAHAAAPGECDGDARRPPDGNRPRAALPTSRRF